MMVRLIKDGGLDEIFTVRHFLLDKLFLSTNFATFINHLGLRSEEAIATLESLRGCNEANFVLLEKSPLVLNMKGMEGKLEIIQYFDIKVEDMCPKQ